MCAVSLSGWGFRLALAFLGVLAVVVSPNFVLATTDLQLGYSLPPATGTIVLTVSGNITLTNSKAVNTNSKAADSSVLTEPNAVFDLALLRALPQAEVLTHNPWFAGQNLFRGPLGSTLVQAVGAQQASSVRVASINGFMAEIPLSDFMQYEIIFALEMNQRQLKIRDLGPVFVIYPFDAYPNLKTEMHYNRSVWQVNRLEFF